jgi:hypothetical protein
VLFEALCACWRSVPGPLSYQVREVLVTMFRMQDARRFRKLSVGRQETERRR